MPDKSCRTCGGELFSHQVCSECRKPTQRMCLLCNRMTIQEYHQNCLNIATLKTERRMKVDLSTMNGRDLRSTDSDLIKSTSKYEIFY